MNYEKKFKFREINKQNYQTGIKQCPEKLCRVAGAIVR